MSFYCFKLANVKGVQILTNATRIMEAALITPFALIHLGRFTVENVYPDILVINNKDALTSLADVLTERYVTLTPSA